jgi:hypothetical protein
MERIKKNITLEQLFKIDVDQAVYLFEKLGSLNQKNRPHTAFREFFEEKYKPVFGVDIVKINIPFLIELLGEKLTTTTRYKKSGKWNIGFELDSYTTGITGDELIDVLWKGVVLFVLPKEKEEK